VPRPFGRVPYKPLSFQFLGGHPRHPLPKQPSKWLPRFSGDGVTKPSEHIYNFHNALTVNQVGEYEDVYMKHFASTFEGNVSSWLNNLRENSITGYDMFEKKFRDHWEHKVDDRFLLNQLYEIKRKEGELIQDFNHRFDTLVAKIDVDLKPTEKAITLHYTNAFEGHFGFLLREKNPISLLDAQDKVVAMDSNVLATGKIDLFGSSRSAPKPQPKPKESLVNENPTPTLEELAQMMKTMMQMQMREKPKHEPPRPHYIGPGFQPGYGRQPRRPNKQQGKVPNTLSPQNLVSDDLF